MAVAFVVHHATSKQRYRYVTNIASVIILLRFKPHIQCTVLGRLHVLYRRVVGPFRSVYFLTLPCRQDRRDHFSLQKCPKIRYFNVDFLKNFPRPTPLSAPAFRASAPRSGSSVPPSTGPLTWPPFSHF